MTFRNRRRDLGIRQRVNDIDRTNVAIVIAGAILILVIVLPRVYPAAKRGIECSDLASPLGGNNRSVLAQSGGDLQELDLDLQLETDAIAPGEPLLINVIFINKDIGPAILYLPQRSPLTNRDNVLVLQITRLDAPLLAESPATTPTTYQLNELHLLGSRARCNEHIEISAVELSNLGITPGSEYRIEATYRNTQVGNPQPLQTELATATMAYPTSQGVWIGEVSSDEARFTMLQAGAAPP